MLGRSGSLAYEPWPAADESLLVQNTYNLPVQVRAAPLFCCVVLLPAALCCRAPRRPAVFAQKPGRRCAPRRGRLALQRRNQRGCPLPRASSISLPRQVNGKMRGAVEVPVDIGQDDALAAARAVAAVAKQLEGKEVKKVIFVQGKILNLIVK